MLERNNAITSIVAAKRFSFGAQNTHGRSATLCGDFIVTCYACNCGYTADPAPAQWWLAKVGNGGTGRFGISVAFWPKGLWDRLWVYTQWRY
jgi:hypothetical protein